jgi:hypothetical protein
VNNIGVGTGVSNYFQPVNWNISYFNYFILDNNATKIVGKHEFQFGGHFRHDQLNYMPQQQRTAGNLSYVANTTALFDPANSSSIEACQVNPANCVRRPLQNTGDFVRRRACTTSARTRMRCTFRTAGASITASR